MVSAPYRTLTTALNATASSHRVKFINCEKHHAAGRCSEFRPNGRITLSRGWARASFASAAIEIVLELDRLTLETVRRSERAATCAEENGMEESSTLGSTHEDSSGLQRYLVR